MCIIDTILNNATSKEQLKYLQDTVLLIREIKKNHPDWKLVLFSSEVRDYSTVNNLKKMINDQSNIEFKFIGSKDELLLLYSRLSLVIGTRMHSMIIAVSQKIPIIGISWQPKVNEIFAILNDNDSVFNISELADYIEPIVRIAEKKIFDEVAKDYMSKTILELEKFDKVNFDILKSIMVSGENGKI